MSIKALREKMFDCKDQRRELIENAMDEVRTLTPEERSKKSELETQVSDMEKTLALLDEMRYSEDFTFTEEPENAKAEALKDEMVDFVQSGFVGTELRAFADGKLNTTTDHSIIIPTEMSNFILEKMTESSDVFAEATKIPAVKGKFNLVADDEEESLAVIVDEGKDFTDWKQMKFKSRPIDQNRYVAGYMLTQQLLNDANYDLVSFCLTKLAKKHARKAENEIFNGAGTDTDLSKGFRGLAAYPGIGEITTAVKDVITIDELNTLYNTLHPNFLNSSKWYMNRDLYQKVAQLQDAEGHYYVQNGVVNGKLGSTLFGLPIVVSDKITKAVPCFLGDIKEAYSIMIKKDFELKHVFADTTQAIQGTHLLLLDIYMDGTVLNTQAVVRLKNKAE